MGALVGEAVPVMSRRWALLAQLALGALGVVIVLLTLSLGTRSPLGGSRERVPFPVGCRTREHESGGRGFAHR